MTFGQLKPLQAVETEHIPFTFTVFRLLTGMVTVALIAVIIASFAGVGPGHELYKLTDRSLTWVSQQIGVQLR